MTEHEAPITTPTETLTVTPAWLRSIAPPNHPKYSPNLHRWLKKNARNRKPPGIFVGAGGVEGFDGHLFIGWLNTCGCHPDDLTGSRLWQVLGSGGRAIVGVWVGRGHFVEQKPDFWGDYLRIGRCAVDPKHEHSFIGDETRFVEEGDVRTCTWCGAVQRRERYEVVKHRERWVDAVGAL